MKSILVSIPLFALLAGCGESPNPSHTATAESPVAVRTQAASFQGWPDNYEATGTVRARTAAAISSKVMGYVREVTVQTGDRVEAGKALVRLDARDLEAGYRQAEAARNEAQSAVAEVESAVAAAKANLDLAQVTDRRMQDLFDKKSISNQEMDETNARLKAAQAGYDAARSKQAQLKQKIAQAEEAVQSAAIMKSYAEITAPFAGTVTEKRVDPGNLATPGFPLLTLEREGSYRLEANVEESKLPLIRRGQAVDVMIDAIGQRLRAQVSEIVPAVDAASRSYIVKIDLPAHPQLRSGIFGRAIFPLGTRRVLAIPSEAVVERGQVQSVFVADGGVARVRLVTLGTSAAGQREVLSGLAAGEMIVVPIPSQLADGAKVEVRQ